MDQIRARPQTPPTLTDFTKLQKEELKSFTRASITIQKAVRGLIARLLVSDMKAASAGSTNVAKAKTPESKPSPRLSEARQLSTSEPLDPNNVLNTVMRLMLNTSSVTYADVLSFKILTEGTPLNIAQNFVITADSRGAAAKQIIGLVLSDERLSVLVTDGMSEFRDVISLAVNNEKYEVLKWALSEPRLVAQYEQSEAGRGIISGPKHFESQRAEFHSRIKQTTERLQSEISGIDESTAISVLEQMDSANKELKTFVTSTQDRLTQYSNFLEAINYKANTDASRLFMPISLGVEKIEKSIDDFVELTSKIQKQSVADEQVDKQPVETKIQMTLSLKELPESRQTAETSQSTEKNQYIEIANLAEQTPKAPSLDNVFEAYEDGDYEAIQSILAQDPSLLNQHHADGYTLLFKAIEAGKLDLVCNLLTNEARPELEVKDAEGKRYNAIYEAWENAQSDNVCPQLYKEIQAILTGYGKETGRQEVMLNAAIDIFLETFRERMFYEIQFKDLLTESDLSLHYNSELFREYHGEYNPDFVLEEFDRATKLQSSKISLFRDAIAAKVLSKDVDRMTDYVTDKEDPEKTFDITKDYVSEHFSHLSGDEKIEMLQRLIKDNQNDTQYFLNKKNFFKLDVFGIRT